MSIVAIDVGLKRIGAAVYLENVIVPLDAILRRNRVQAARDISTLLREYKAEILVAGLSANDEMQRRIRHFVSLLEFDGEIAFTDEDFSSCEAKERMKGVVKQKRDGRVDSLAAMIILERYLQNRLSKPAEKY
ncbi:MAG: Holliday junction resolvase RuvX [Campylobacteraceae bacterium]|jgi:putative Holliday junction resolvase|nr:Holliday junction resolvase RuvX [Campylobacteraceae bacterium]